MSTDVSRLDPTTIRRLQPLWDYLAISEPPVPADAIFVFGSKDFAVPARAAELYRDGYAAHVLVTGSYGRMTRDVFPKSEALVFKDRLIEGGVPEAAVITEEEAANTLENVRFGMKTLTLRGLSPRTLLLVAKGFVMRRCVATFAVQFRDVKVVPCPPVGGIESALDRSGPAFSTRLAAEVSRLDRYAAKGDVGRQQIPGVVRSIARELRVQDTTGC